MNIPPIRIFLVKFTQIHFQMMMPVVPPKYM